MKIFRRLFMIILAFAAGAGAIWFSRPKTPAKKVDLSGLRAQLDAAAEKNLPLPSLDAAPLPTPGSATPK